jgi:hypothetical protein
MLGSGTSCIEIHEWRSLYGSYYGQIRKGCLFEQSGRTTEWSALILSLGARRIYCVQTGENVWAVVGMTSKAPPCANDNSCLLVYWMRRRHYFTIMTTSDACVSRPRKSVKENASRGMKVLFESTFSTARL